jgi:hypothetical protein
MLWCMPQHGPLIFSPISCPTKVAIVFTILFSIGQAIRGLSTGLTHKYRSCGAQCVHRSSGTSPRSCPHKALTVSIYKSNFSSVSKSGGVSSPSSGLLSSGLLSSGLLSSGLLSSEFVSPDFGHRNLHSQYILPPIVLLQPLVRLEGLAVHQCSLAALGLCNRRFGYSVFADWVNRHKTERVSSIVPMLKYCAW